MVRKLVIFIVLTISFGGFVSISKARKQEALLVTTAVAKQGSIEDTILASGHFVFDKQVQMRSEVTGRVEEILVVEGQEVEAGYKLITLDDSAFIARVNSMKAQANAQYISLLRTEEVRTRLLRKLSRQKKLYQQSLVHQDFIDELQSQVTISDLDIQAAREQLNQARASLNEAEQELAKSVFKAPISGVVTHVGVKEGETVVAGTTNIIGSELLVLADPSSLRAEIKVDEADAGSVNIGQKVKLFSAADPEKPITGSVSKIGFVAKRPDANRGMVILLHVSLDSYEQRLFAEMSCRAEIIKQRLDSMIKVPIASIQKSLINSDDYFVWTLEDERAVRQEVTIGMANDTELVVLTGLSEGQSVISGPGRTIRQLREGMLVSAKPL